MNVLKRFALFVTLISLFLFLSGCFMIPKEEEVLAPILKEPPKVVYTTIEVKKSTFEKKVQVIGTFVSVSQADMCFKNISGRLKGIYVKNGDEVKKGTLLAELITNDLDSQIAQKELSLKKSQITLDNIKISTEKDIYIQSKQLKNLKNALIDMEANPLQYSKKEIDDLKDQIEQNETVYKSTVQISKNNIELAKNDLESCRLQLENIKNTLNNSKLIAPIDGIVDYVSEVKDGDLIDAYSTVVTIANPKELQLQYNGDKVSEFELGQTVTVKVDDIEIQGKVVMSPFNVPLDADEKTRNSIQIKLNKLPDGISIGNSADLILISIKKDNVIVLNKNIIHSVGDRKFVYVLEKGVKRERDVELGEKNMTETIIVKGLSEGDSVIGE